MSIPFFKNCGPLTEAYVNETKMADAIWSATIVDKK